MIIAGSLDLAGVLLALSSERQVFHSEADFQHSFAWMAHRLEPRLQVRLETHPEPGVRLDLLISRPDSGASTSIELKYLTAAWAGKANGEAFALSSQRAQDTRGYDVVRDIGRVERFVSQRPGANGLVLVLTNDPSYWRPPNHGRDTNAAAFRIHEGSVLAGSLAWGLHTGDGTMKGRRDALHLDGAYRCGWQDYSELPGRRGLFRLMAISVG